MALSAARLRGLTADDEHRRSGPADSIISPMMGSAADRLAAPFVSPRLLGVDALDHLDRNFASARVQAAFVDDWEFRGTPRLREH